MIVDAERRASFLAERNFDFLSSMLNDRDGFLTAAAEVPSDVVVDDFRRDDSFSFLSSTLFDLDDDFLSIRLRDEDDLGFFGTSPSPSSPSSPPSSLC